MTDEEKKAIENIKEDIKYADLRDLVDDDCTVCFVEDLETILNLLEKQDNRIKELEKERQADKEKIKELEDKLNEEAYIRVSAGAHNRICELEKENKRLYEENQIYALEGSRVRLQIHIEKNYIPKVKVIEALQDIEDYFDRLNVPDEDIEFIQSIEEELLKDGGE